ncbi:putative alfa-L-rhamnosidase [Cutaneotrichosporon oleaginosum]|uniref:alpha-L-rhamnosidase n=1 Tax=Cutaneotrichosporon oleaginosum TaxID=879819 RepID=A0A0J0XHG9_9TREE|nr:putative alfa-L-rhamnosidase [Cutaneotrichosporon oleaginosum]KLT40575.1 putative alfa-L-rhamnosidase [Cutaneotrichosporon oleaginosum]TXT03901.1 hypothetical protein COLE_07598 [Cutaneotrichosporon oleaginosum]
MSIIITKVSFEHYEPGAALGIATPRISWRFGGDAENWEQASYEIAISRSGQSNSFKVESSDSVLVPWPDKPLTSRERASISVTAHGKDGSSAAAQVNVEAALLQPADWTAQAVSRPTYPDNVAKRPCLLRRRFALETLPKTARLYITAMGLYEATLNGQRIGDHVLAPGWQSYSYRLAYQVFDVAPLLKEGTNELCAWVGEGWWAGRLGFHTGARDIWGTRPALVAQLEAEGKVLAQTDDGWEWAEGPIVGSELYDGEAFDTTLSLTAFKPAEVLPRPLHLVAPQAPPVRRTAHIPASEIIITPSGKTIVDFGQNLVGWLRWNNQVDGTGTVTIRHAEVLEHGELGTRPLRFADATDTVVLGGKTEGHEPKFTFHGFRYAEVTGFPRAVEKDDFTAVVVHSDFERTAHFESSHKELNQLYSNVVWGLRGNFVSVPTDCPQRDERLGWTADLMAFAPTASMIYDVNGLLSEWLGDVAAEQLDYGKGRPPFVVPNIPLPGQARTDTPPPVAVWSDVTTITPLDIYTTTGDVSLLRDQWRSMKAWIDEGIPRTDAGLWKRVFQFGDWLDPRAPPEDAANGMTDPTLVADAYLIHSVRIAAKVALVLGQEEDQRRYESEAARLLDAFQAEYVSPKGRITSDSQCAYVLALQFRLAKSEEQAEFWAATLERLVRQGIFKVGTGFASTPFVLLALAAHGRLQVAYRMLQEGECPSWLYQVKMGATTMWERWNSMLPSGEINPGEMTSFNHYAFGSVGAFLHQVIGGIRALEPGWKRIAIHPRPGGTLTDAATSFTTPYGEVSCRWVLKGERTRIEATVVVPPNTTAELMIGDQKLAVGSGTHRVEGVWKDESEWPPQPISYFHFPGDEKKSTFVP